MFVLGVHAPQQKSSRIGYSKKIMSMLSFLKPSSTLPTSSAIGIRVIATDKANAAIEKELDWQSSTDSTKRKAYTALSAETHAESGRYTVEYGNSEAMRKFRSASRITDRAQCAFLKSAILRR